MSNKDEVLDNLLSPTQWVRIFFMLMFAIITWFALVIAILVIVLQCLFNLITAKSNENLQNAAKVIALYFYQIVSFLTYVSNNKPFPFSPLPSADSDLADLMAPSETSDQASEEKQDSNVSTASEASSLGTEEVKAAQSEGVEDAEQEASTEDASSQKSTEAVKESSASVTASTELNDDVFADISFTDVDEGPSSAADVEKNDKGNDHKDNKDKDDKDKEKSV